LNLKLTETKGGKKLKFERFKKKTKN